MRYPSVILFIVVLLSFSSCGKREAQKALDQAEQCMNAHPDSALAIIRAIDTTTLTTPKLRAHYALLHAMALDKNWIDTTDVNVVMPAVDYYDRHPSGIRCAKAWYYLGRIQQNGNDRQEASISFLKAERYAEASDDSDFKGLVCLAMSTIYSQTHFHEEALRYSEKAHTLFAEAGDTLNANGALYGMAQEYYDLGRYAEADSLYCALIENKTVHPNLYSELLSNYALSCVFHSDDYARAVNLFDEAIATKGSLKNWNYWGAYAYALMRTGDNVKADKIFKQLAAGRSSSQRYLYDYWKSLSDAYEENHHSAYLLLKEASSIQDENVKKAFRQSAIKAQKDFLEQMNLETERTAKRRQTLSWCSIALLLVVIFLLLFLFRRRKERNAREQEELIDAYKSLTMEHSALSSRYSELSAEVDRIEKEKAAVRNKYIQLCQSHFNRIGRINEVLHYHSAEKDNKLYAELKRSIRNIGMDNKSQSEFELLLNESFDNVMLHFREVFPKKKEPYYRLVSFFFAGFDTATILVFLPNYNMHNIHVEKSRLRQAIAKTESPYREQFLQLLS